MTRGFWNERELKATKGNQHFDGPQPRPPVPATPPGRVDPNTFPEGDWRSHPDADAVARAAVSKCTKESHRDS